MAERRWLRRSGLGGLLAIVGPLLLALLAGSGNRASAAVIGCSPLVGGGLGTPVTFDIRADWHLGSASGSEPLDWLPGPHFLEATEVSGGKGIDLDHDGRDEANVSFNITDAHEALDDGSFQLNALHEFAGSPADTLLREQRGIDYGPSVISLTEPSASPLYLSATILNLTEDELPAGSITITADVSLTDGTSTSYAIAFDTSGASSATQVWPSVTIGSALLDDHKIHDGLAVGVASFGPDGTVAPVSNLAVDVTIDQGVGTNRDKHARLALVGPLTTGGGGRPTAVGMPGTAALAVADQCTILPVETWVGMQLGGPTGLLPAGLDLDATDFGAGDVNGNGTLDVGSERTLYLDGHIDHPASLLTITNGSTQADVDGNGSWDGVDLDGVDANSDSIPDDRLPWQYVSLHHDGAAATLPHVQVVFAQQSPSPNAPDVYVALDAQDVPNDVALDRAGLPGGVDADGDGAFDDLNGDGILDGHDVRSNDAVGSLSFCPRDRTTFPGTCTAPTSTAGPIQVTFRSTLPTAGTDGNLPVVADRLRAAPTDITDTTDGHFTPLPADWVVVEAERTADDRVDVTAATIDVAALSEATWDLRGEAKVQVRTAGIGQFGAQVTLIDDLNSSVDSVWSVLADAPNNVSITADLQQESVDGDPMAVSWDLHGQRTAAAVAIDAVLPSDDRRVVAASVWIGTGDGHDDGLVAGATTTVDLEGGDKSLHYDEATVPCKVIPLGQPGAGTCILQPDTTNGMALDVGFSTRTSTQAMAGLLTRGHVMAVIDDHLAVDWSDDGSTLTGAELSTCADPASCPVRHLDATIVTTTGPIGTGLTPHDTLTGVDMLSVPDESLEQFPDFAADPSANGQPLDFSHVVTHDTPRREINDLLEPAGPTDARDTWGVDIRLSELRHATYGRATRLWSQRPVFSHSDACVDATVANGFDLGFYEDTGEGTAATWFDGSLDRDDHRLYGAFEWNTPVDGKGDAAPIGDLTTNQQDYVDAQPSETDLFKAETTGCGGTGQGGMPATLTGQLRRGTASAVAQIQQIGTQSKDSGRHGIGVPATDGIDAALYSTPDRDPARSALDAGVRVDIPTFVEIRQPRLQRCGVGNQRLDRCHDLPLYDTTDITSAWLQVESNSQLPLGDLDIEQLGEPSGTETIDPEATDDKALRSAFHIDSLPGELTFDATVQRRPRDGFVDVHATLESTRGALVGGRFSYRDDYRPATLLDPSEDGSVTDQPLASFVLEHVGMRFTVAATTWAPVYGWNGTVFTTSDCRTGWPSGIQRDHVYPFGDDPSSWDTIRLREPDELRRPYVHGVVDLDPQLDGTPAETVSIEVDARVDQPGDFQNSYDDPERHAVKVGIETDGVPTDGEVWGLQPGLQLHQHTTTQGEFEACIDGDIPIHLDWDQVSSVHVGLDLAKATFSIPNTEKAAGGDANLAVEERTTPDFTTSPPDVVEGIFMHQLKTWFRVAPFQKDWATLMVDERLSVGMLDPGDLKLEVPPHDRIGIQANLASGWKEQGVEADRFYGEILTQILFAPSVEAELADNKLIADIVDGWTGLWNRIDGMTERITSWVLPVEAASTVMNRPFDFETVKNCVTAEKNANWATFVPQETTADGTTFEFDVRWDNNRVQLYLVARYSNGEVRYVRELYDADPGTKTCKVGLDGGFTIDASTGRTRVDVRLQATNKDPAQPTDWTTVLDQPFVFDASGDGWFVGFGQVLPDVEAGTTVELTGGADPAGGQACVWYPGDGTRIVPGEPENAGASATHVYAFPGTYQVLEFCYVPPSPNDSRTDRFQGFAHEWTVTVT